jgi:hypothetical protein
MGGTYEDSSSSVGGENRVFLLSEYLMETSESYTGSNYGGLPAKSKHG